jgi:hypothetical protein
VFLLRTRQYIPEDSELHFYEECKRDGCKQYNVNKSVNNESSTNILTSRLLDYIVGDPEYIGKVKLSHYAMQALSGKVNIAPTRS